MNLSVARPLEPSADETEYQVDPLGAFVNHRFQIARVARLNVSDELIRCLKQRRGEYGLTEMEGMGNIQTFLKHTETKCRAGESWINDVLASTQSRPFTISPTPVEEIPDFIREQIVQQVKTELMAAGAKGPINFDVKQRIRDLRDLAKKYIDDYAKKACDKMANEIEDILDQDNFDSTLKDFVGDLITYPYAVLKGPIVTLDRQLVWRKNKPVIVEKPRLTTARVSPFDFYWAPWATDPNKGYCVELMHMQSNDLYKWRGKKGFNSKNIEELLEELPDGFIEQDGIQYRKMQLETQMNNIQEYNRNGMYDVLNYWGDIRGKELADFKIPDLEEDVQYQVNVWVCAGKPLYAMLNPHPLGNSPFKVTSYGKLPGSLVGNCVPSLMRPYQEVMNSCIRALRRNLGLASGPFTEVDQSRLAGDTPPEELAPMMIKLVEPDITGGGQPVYRFTQIPSNAQELDAVLEKQMRYCDDATGIPAYSYGAAGQAGVGRTVGGLAILMGNASKGIKQVIANMEHDVLEPLITDYFTYLMMYDNDNSIKGDAKVVVRGPSGIILKEAAIQKRLEGLQILAPYMNNIDQKGIKVVLREILGALDFPVDDIIPDPLRQEQVNQAVQESGGQPPGVPGAVPQPSAPQPMQLNAPGNGTPMPVPANAPIQMRPPQSGQGTVPTPVVDNRSGAAARLLATG